MSTGEAFGYIGVPLIIFVLGGIGTGITLLWKGSAYMARSAAAQESTATTNAEINQTLKNYMASNDDRVNSLGLHLATVDEWRRGVDEWRRSVDEWRRQSDRERP